MLHGHFETMQSAGFFNLHFHAGFAQGEEVLDLVHAQRQRIQPDTCEQGQSMSNRMRTMRSTATKTLALGFAASLLTQAATSLAAGPYLGMDALIAELDDASRRNSEFVIVPGQLGDFEPGPPHGQYRNLCWLFATQTANEYLGFARHVTGSHYTISRDTNDDGSNHGHDVGYWGSPEYVIADGIDYQHQIHGTGVLPASYYTSADTMDACSGLAATPDYARCANNSTTWGGFQGLGIDSDVVQIFDEYYTDKAPIGCNDYRSFSYSAAKRDDLRRIIKAFVDNNTPFITNVACQHNVTIIGYGDIDASGLPTTAIGVDAHTDGDTTPRYFLYENLDQDASWRDSGNYHSICKVRPRNQHLNGGCDSSGWAAQLDASLTNSSLQVCSLPSGTVQNCNEGDINARFYGITVQCWNDGSLQDEFHATPENPFITVPRNTACDDVVAYYNDGRSDRYVTSSKARRYGYHETNEEWVLMSTYTGVNDDFTMSGHSGLQNEMTFASWSSNYAMVYTGAASPYTQRRTTLEFTFNTSEKVTVEVSPPGTYGVHVQCNRNGNNIWSRFIEADHNKTTHQTSSGLEEYQNALEDSSLSCDSLYLNLSLGETKAATSATVTRFGYLDSAGEWRKLNGSAPWSSDTTAMSKHSGRSGATYSFGWHDSWPDGYRFVGHGISDSYSERKTVLDVTFDDGSTRSIAVSPF